MATFNAYTALTGAATAADDVLGIWDTSAVEFKNITTSQLQVYYEANMSYVWGQITGVPSASDTAQGIVELATIAETNTGTDATRAVTPDGLDGWTGSAQVTTLGTVGGFTSTGIDDNATSVAVTIDASENVGIKNVSPTVALDVTGAILASADITAYSDIRLKTDIQNITGALDKVDQLWGVTFLRSDERDGVRHTGLIAQELQAVLPEAVRVGTDANRTLSVAYGNTVGLLVEAIKELRAEVEALKNGSSS